MALRTTFLRDPQGRVLGTIIEGYGDGSSQVRNKFGQLIGRVEPGPGITKAQSGEIIALNADPGLLFAPGFSEGDDE